MKSKIGDVYEDLTVHEKEQIMTHDQIVLNKMFINKKNSFTEVSTHITGKELEELANAFPEVTPVKTLRLNNNLYLIYSTINYYINYLK